jgi:DNA-directed RNA polymerase subunit RPC12/RpoP
MRPNFATYARTVAEPETQIDLRCPHCGHVWNANAILFGVWWGRGVTPEMIARGCHCPRCKHDPPMEPAPPRVLFEEDARP